MDKDYEFFMDKTKEAANKTKEVLLNFLNLLFVGAFVAFVVFYILFFIWTVLGSFFIDFDIFDNLSSCRSGDFFLPNLCSKASRILWPMLSAVTLLILIGLNIGGVRYFKGMAKCFLSNAGLTKTKNS